jgi:hypothetical protein
MIASARRENRTATHRQSTLSSALPFGAPEAMRSVALVSMILVSLALGSRQSMAGDVTPSAESAMLEIISPKDGDTVSSPLVVKFGLAGMGVAPAGVTIANTGHHHLIIDAPLPDLDFAIPKDAKHRHFGGGQTQVSVELEPGQHTLQLLLGDYRHIPHDPPLSSKKITITVK